MDRIDPNDLMMFAYIVEQGSFKGAADRTGIPHSTISRRIMLLEAQLGEKLLHRTTRKITLTEFGKGALTHARQITAEVEAAEELIQGRSPEPCGRLRISIPTDFTSDILGSLLTRFAVAYPKITLDIDVSRRRVDLVAENFDLAIRIGSLPDDATLIARRVGTFHMGLYASPSYLNEYGLPRHPDDLATHAILHLTQRFDESMTLNLNWDQQNWKGKPERRVAANTPGVLMHMAMNGAGIVNLASHFARDNVQAGRLIGILDKWQQPEIPIWAIVPGRRLLPVRTRTFIDQLKADLSN
ncbi:LysR family transcriptional regulator [Paenirhodobacter populi]|uniref:LysR family transcriptional regulator n=1 Tax=Paenirhodobacter populi TaxID=2306993 RepID=A0A443JR66_9RHOB|nr:LysR family transcriptional regulator [Sinirhodobacter populi]RWR22996.1 LysR family transcriptional regulator [Sinirhodobacter populi]